MQLRVLSLIRPLPVWRPVFSSKVKKALQLPANILLAVSYSALMLLLIGLGFLIKSTLRKH